ncbi:MAG: hypothetical protein LBO65_02945 [Spirochaetaceae bacterium]|jgi:hypothetical protein|nr:hypothetical protein [Spirochaetaceae bacterium]
MAGNDNYPSSLSQALRARADWIEKSEMAKFKEELRSFQVSYASLYNIFLKKGLIHEDPYKQEARIGEIEVPSTSGFSEAERVEQLSIRLANYDNQLDFLVNFYQFNLEFFTLDRIKRVLGLIKFVDWAHLSMDSPFPVTKAMMELTMSAKNGLDPLTLSLFNESLNKISRATGAIIGYLKIISDYHRESYKFDLRATLTGDMKAPEATLGNIKKKFASAMPGRPFYPDLVEELIKEDYSADGPALREKVLKGLQVEEAKPKLENQQVSFKQFLIEGLHVIGNVGNTLQEIVPKIDENEAMIANRRKSLWQSVCLLVQQIMGKAPDPVVLELTYMDALRGTQKREKVNYTGFRQDLDKRIRVLGAYAARGMAAQKLGAMNEEQLTQILDRLIRDMQNTHRTLSAMDDFFKAEAAESEREKVKGIKPELAAMKNAIVRANQIRHDYSARKEEEEQMRRLGIAPGA